MTKPLVSIIIPCYNHECFLDDCLQSILDQDYPNIELLICDDCSPDNSYNVILSYETKLRNRFQHVIILHNEVNCGVTKNINRMLAQAHGNYIKILASDDALAPNAISTLVAFLEANPQYGVAVSNGITVAEDQHYPHFEPTSVVYPEAPDFSPAGMFVQIARRNPVFAPGAIVRRSVYNTFGYYDETIAIEDLEYWLRIAADSRVMFGYTPAKLIYYRINSNSMSSQAVNAKLQLRRERMHNSSMESFSKYKDYFPAGVYEEICLLRILEEWGFALEHGFTQWAATLRQQWAAFPRHTNLKPKTYLYLHGRCLKMRLKFSLVNKK